MSKYTEELLKNLSIVGSAARRFVNTENQEKKAPAQQLVLDILAEEDGLTQGVLAEILDIRPSSLTEVLNKLEQRGEIKRQEDPKDKRIKQVFISEVGRAKVTPAQDRQERSEEFFAGLSEEEQKQLDQLINKIVNGWVGDIGDYSDIPRMPFEALGSIKAFRKQFKKEFMDEDMWNMSPHERRQMKREMRDFMRHQLKQHPFKQGRRGEKPFDCDPRQKHNDPRPDKFNQPDDGEWDNW